MCLGVGRVGEGCEGITATVIVFLAIWLGYVPIIDVKCGIFID